MNISHIPVRLVLLTTLALIVFLAGCSRAVPQPVSPAWHSQETIQAADHWRGLAVDVADKVRDALVQRDDLLLKPVCIAAPDSRPFMLAFHRMLTTELVSRGVQVAEVCEPDSLALEYDVLTIKHTADRPGLVPRHEVVVTTRLSHNNRYVLHLSSVRYINDDEWPMYFSGDSLMPSAGKKRTVQVRNR